MKIESVVAQIQRHKRKIILFWIGLTVFALFTYSAGFLGKTINEFDPPDNSDAARAIELQRQYFPETIDEGSHIITIHHQDGVVGQELAVFTQDIVIWVNDHYADISEGIQGYYIVANTTLDYLKDQFVSDDGTTTFLSVTVSATEETQSLFLEELREHIAELDIDTLDIYVTGFQALSDDTNHAIENDLSRIDAITIPLVFILLVILLRNWRYFPITMTTIVMALSVTFAVLERFITLFDATIPSFVPSVLISLTLGIGVDYNLFLLSRFKEEKGKGFSNLEAVTTMMKRAGHTVFTSGLTLVISMAGLIFFPISMINSLGIAISIGIAILLIINLTLTPAILLVFGNWFEKTPDSTQTDVSGSAKKPENSQTGFWYRIGKTSTRYSKVVLLLTLLLTVPLAVQLIDTNPETETQFFAPRHSDSSEGFQLLEDKFEPGLISPLQLVFVPEDENVWSSNSFLLLHTFIEASIDQTTLETADIQSHTWLGSQKIDFDTAMALITPESPVYNSLDAQIYRQFALGYVSSEDGLENQAALVQITLPIDPNSQQGRALYHDLDDIAEDIFGVAATFGFIGATATNDATITSAYELFPIMILLVILAIYALVGIMFRSVLLPARLIATIGLTISFIYGAATVVFQSDTFLNNIFPTLSDVSVVYWMLPIMSSSIILGLGMDYDIFTIERIKENVWQGMENDEAIAQGLNKTGRIITGAGLIMMVAFGGMMFSSSYILVQFGFVLTFAVFLDTFVVRSILVPSIMSLSHKYNWWPNKPPTDVISIEKRPDDGSYSLGD